MNEIYLRKGGILWIMKQNLILGLTLKLQEVCGLR